MPIPGLPRGKRSQIFRAVEKILRADAVLAAAVKTWRTFDGSENSIAPPFASLCPWVRLSLVPRRTVRADEATYEVPVGIRVEVATAGEYFDDQADLWEAIVAAMVATKPAFGTTVADYLWNRSVVAPDGSPAAGATDWYFEDPSISGVPADKDPAMLVGVGTFVVGARIPC